jgi:PhnB protein
MARSARKATRSQKAAPKKSAAKAMKRAPARAAKKAAKPAKAAKKRPARVQAVPDAYGSLTPVLVVSPANDAIEYYKKAFGAKVGLKMDGPGGAVMHAELKIGNSILMLADEMPPMGPGPQTRKTPKSIGNTTASVMLYVKNADAVFAQAVAAGGTVVMPVMDIFWGDRYGQIEDPFGHLWSIATHTKDMTAKQMRDAGAAAMAEMAKAPQGAPPAEG